MAGVGHQVPGDIQGDPARVQPMRTPAVRSIQARPRLASAGLASFAELIGLGMGRFFVGVVELELGWFAGPGSGGSA
jgi:hypothetical protein